LFSKKNIKRNRQINTLLKAEILGHLLALMQQFQVRSNEQSVEKLIVPTG